METIQLGEDLVGGLGPDEGLGVGVVPGDVAMDCGMQARRSYPRQTGQVAG
jgi:hypothetical protein